MSSPAQQDEEELKKTLFGEVMRGNWDKVVEIYQRHKSVRTAKVTRAEDTALHVAVYEGDPDVVKMLVDIVMADNTSGQVLPLKNDRKNTPLHLAAALGMLEACNHLAAVCPQLITEERNEDGETPLFVAANHGKDKVFFLLQRLIPPHISKKSDPDVISYCRRKDGDNILHRAIYGEYFELAFQIIQYFPMLVNSKNEKGESPLHILASKPSAFRSGCRIRYLDWLIYRSIIIDPLRPKNHAQKAIAKSKGFHVPERKSELSKSYKVCLEAKSILVHAYKVIGNHFGKRKRENENIIRDKKENMNSIELFIKEDQAEQGGLEKTTYSFPPNYVVCFNSIKAALKFMLIVLGVGVRKIEKIRRKKQKHNYAYQLMKELIQKASIWEYDEDAGTGSASASQTLIRKELQSIVESADAGKSPNGQQEQKKGETGQLKKETPILLAAKMGNLEMVKKILTAFPIAIQDLDSDGKNIILLAAEYRQPHIYKYMLERNKEKKSIYIFGMVDRDGNSATHLAAKLPEKIEPWDIPGAALQMHWESKWYKYIKNSMELNFFPPENRDRESARMIFSKYHEELINKASKWLTDTSTACSVVATLIATVAFTSAVTVPGGVRQDTGFPLLQGQPAFTLFAISSLVALCFSVTSLVMFLSILTSRYQEKDFEKNLPVKLITGLTSLFTSIGAMLIAFCGGHFYIIENKLRNAAYPIYGVVCIPVTVFALAQFPLYFDLIKATFTDVPERTFRSRAIMEDISSTKLTVYFDDKKMLLKVLGSMAQKL